MVGVKLAVLCLLAAGIITYFWIDRFDPASLKNKRVLVTGASTGIGEQLAYHYAKFGARLVITARRKERLEQVVAACRDVGDRNGDYHYMTFDMTNLNATNELIKFAIETLGGLDILVLNHIVVAPLQEWKGTPENFHYLDTITDVNFKSYVYLSTHAMPALEESHGSLIVVSSIAGKIGQPFTAAYSAAKHALHGFFGGLRQEQLIRHVPVSITTCVIGLIGTDNCLTQMRKFELDYIIDALKPADPSDTALAIVKGGATRAREIYYPYMEAKLVTLLRDWIPGALEWFTGKLYNRET